MRKTFTQTYCKTCEWKSAGSCNLIINEDGTHLYVENDLETWYRFWNHQSIMTEQFNSKCPHSKVLQLIDKLTKL